MNIRSWLTLIMAICAIATVNMVILTDPFFHTGLVPRFLAILILAGTYFAVWLGGTIHGLSESSVLEEVDNLEKTPFRMTLKQYDAISLTLFRVAGPEAARAFLANVEISDD